MTFPKTTPEARGGAGGTGQNSASASSPPAGYLEPDCSSDGWTSGCVSAVPRNVLTRFGPVLRPVGRIHWAGTETSEA